MKRAIVPAIFLLILVGAGCVTQDGQGAYKSILGLKTTPECDQKDRLSEKIECYHLAAITMAHLGNKVKTEEICADIWLKFGLSAPTKDMKQRAELEMNDCFFDAAKILGDPQMCNFITQGLSSNTKLFGERSNQLMCVQEATLVGKLKPDYYFQNNTNSLCSALFILPLVLVGAIFAGRRR